MKFIAFALSLIPLAFLLAFNTQLIGAEVNLPWFPAVGIQFHLAIDAISLVFLFLTAIIIPIVILVTSSTTLFYLLILLLEVLLFGFFTARDLAVFTIFWEAMLLPLYFIISLWGGAFRYSAALKFLIYMIAGSSLMVAAVLALYFAGGNTFEMSALASSAETLPYAKWIFFVFLLAFAVKTPLFPFHAWLPDAYVEAPIGGTILLSALLSKAGIYGIFRIGLGLFPHFLQEWSPFLLTLAIIGVLYGGMAAWMQKDYKRLIAYSSFSHVNFVLAGLFVWSQTAHSGALLQAFNHGITIAGLFLVAWWLEERLGSRVIGKVSGLAQFMPILCWLTLVFVLSSVALPGTNNFIGELMILLGVFGHNPWQAAVLGLTVILSVIYMLRWMQKVYFEKPNFFQERWVDIRGKELALALPLILLILWIGIYPAPLLKPIQEVFKP